MWKLMKKEERKFDKKRKGDWAENEDEFDPVTWREQRYRKL